MPDTPNKVAVDPVIFLSDSDSIAASRRRQTQSSPSHPDRKHVLTSPHSPTSKRPRIQTDASSHQSKDPLNSTTPNNLTPNKAPRTPTLHTPASSPRPHPSNNSADTPIPSPRRRSPATTAKPEPPSENNQPNSDEEDAPLDLAKISSYEYEQVAKLNPVQLRRYEQFRRSDLKTTKVRKLVLAINPSSKPTDPYIIAVKGLAKLFVGDIVEAALQVKKSLGDKGALQPKHIREAYRRLRREGAVPFSNQKENTLH